MPEHAQTNWLRRFNSEAIINPTFVSLNAADDDLNEVSGGLRKAFAFLRRHGDRRYSSSSLMRLLAIADRCDGAAASGSRLPDADCPKVITVETPYTFDDETEVKSGGTIAMAVVLPDGKTMLAVHVNNRRQSVGKATITFVESFYGSNLVLWIHAGNPVGQHFALALNMRPWEMNPAGALAYSRQQPYIVQESEAVECMEDYELEDALQRAQGGPRPRRSRPGRVMEDSSPFDEASPIPRRAIPEEALRPIRPVLPSEMTGDEVGAYQNVGCDCDRCDQGRESLTLQRRYQLNLSRTARGLEPYDFQGRLGDAPAEGGWDDSEVEPEMTDPYANDLLGVVNGPVMREGNGPGRVIFNFGRYAGRSIAAVWDQEPEYIQWAARVVRNPVTIAVALRLFMERIAQGREPAAGLELRPPREANYAADVVERVMGSADDVAVHPPDYVVRIQALRRATNMSLTQARRQVDAEWHYEQTERVNADITYQQLAESAETLQRLISEGATVGDAAAQGYTFRVVAAEASHDLTAMEVF